MYNILKKPIVNEKFSQLNAKGVYGFVVSRDANKIQIKQAVETIFNVKVAKVRTAVVAGKKSVRMTKSRVMAGNKPSYKKAYVQLHAGEVLDIYNEI
jgi:large subunit ribosomal protein L23